MYERVSTYNRWDPTLILANVIFYLKDTARVWYETHEDDLTSWDVCKQKLRDLFGRPLGRTLAAKRDLASRAQTSTESYVSYIQDVLALCNRVDNNMPESDKVGHVLKGIASDAFNLLVYKNCTTLDDIIKECRRFEEAKSRRISQPYTRLPITAATSSCEDLLNRQTPAPPENVTRIIRRKPEAMSPAFLHLRDGDNHLPPISMVQAVVCQELANLGLQAVSPVCPSSPPDITAIAPDRPSYFAPRQRNPNDWRTPDDRPICFLCHHIGHISRHCHNYWSRRSAYNPLSSHRNDEQPSHFTPPLARQSATVNGLFSRPSPLRRQSRSPLCRRSSPGPYVR
ncbi:uncharacterized protein LOC144105609 [Amblyomma americanum]